MRIFEDTRIADDERRRGAQAQARVLGMTHPDIVETLQGYGSFASEYGVSNADLLETGVSAAKVVQ